MTMEPVPDPHTARAVARCGVERMAPAIRDTTTLNYDAGPSHDDRGALDDGGGKGVKGLLAPDP
ncbi:MAG: hypothetical protein OXC91_01190 [Rhodobacteraceae bacterium]|nr:hypothetical protein [Paracoccaceae bacterium]